jgi:signal transduction histidine kinase
VTSNRTLRLLEQRLSEPTGTTLELTEDTRSRKELAEALDFRDRVLGILGHDLRNPLSAISALTALTMDRQDLPAGVRERLVQVGQAARRSLTMVETLLDFSESRFTGALSIRPVMADPAEIAQRVAEELRAAHPERTIALDIKSRGPFALDPGRMEQVLCNLVVNALVHGSPDTAVALSIEVREREALFSVSNRGPVIPGEQIARLFEPFTQAVPVEADRPRGLGLGLYIVRHIVAAHGGTVTVDSSSDRGTTFLVRLPRDRAV